MLNAIRAWLRRIIANLKVKKAMKGVHYAADFICSNEYGPTQATVILKELLDEARAFDDWDEFNDGIDAYIRAPWRPFREHEQTLRARYEGKK